ncbi:outer membrane lipoprotein YfeY [Klebsiella pneumoniae subsp. rhinoscleromatis]|nr:outer membrane lipoprotein YfeY [Klebsiella pneumoniae subsp. rhinoscleromatis]
MKSLRVMLCALPLALTGCSTMSAVNWSAAYPWNWFGASTEVTEQGVGKLTASTPLNEQAISDALGSDYRLRSGMKTDKGNIVHYFEALKNNSVALTINGDNGAISRIDVRDADIKNRQRREKSAHRLATCTAKPSATARKAAMTTGRSSSVRPRGASISAMPSLATGAVRTSLCPPTIR